MTKTKYLVELQYPNQSSWHLFYNNIATERSARETRDWAQAQMPRERFRIVRQTITEEEIT